MTDSGDVGTYVKPLIMVRRDGKCSGKMYCANCGCGKRKKKKRKFESIVSIEQILAEGISKELSNGKWKFKGKVGVWRTVNGRRRFFPDDGSGPIPKFEG